MKGRGGRRKLRWMEWGKARYCRFVLLIIPYIEYCSISLFVFFSFLSSVCPYHVWIWYSITKVVYRTLGTYRSVARGTSKSTFLLRSNPALISLTNAQRTTQPQSQINHHHRINNTSIITHNISEQSHCTQIRFIWCTNALTMAITPLEPPYRIKLDQSTNL